MKTFRLKLMMFLCLFCTISVVSAKNLYLSSTGDDSNDGLTESTSVKTLGKIHELISAKDIVHISGIIDISKEKMGAEKEEGTNINQKGDGNLGGFYFKAGNWHLVKMIGKDPEKDGFTGNAISRIFRIDGGTHEFENLLFKNGADVVNDGGNGIWLRGSVATFINCRFEGNKATMNEEDPTAYVKTNGNGGAVTIANGTTNFVNCYFLDNANVRGAALYILGGTVNISGCVFENHNMSAVAGAIGGVIYTSATNLDPIVTIDRCVFNNNKVYKDGGAIAMSNRNDGKSFRTLMTIKNSSFVKNEAYNNGGALFFDNSRAGTNDTIIIANTSFLGNTSDKFGGAIYLGRAQSKSVFSMSNSSLICNSTRGNGGFGAGLTIYETNTSNMLKRIYNCIFDKNNSISQGIDSDLRLRTEPQENAEGEKELIIKNSYVSICLDGNGITGSFFTNENYPGNNINYSSIDQNGENMTNVYNNASGIDDDPAYLLTIPVYAIPLKDDAPARTFGDAEYLSAFGILESDQFGKDRVVEGNACVAGATEATLDEIENDEFSDYPIIVIDDPSGINDAIMNNSENTILLINDVISIAGVTENVTMLLYNISGSIVKSGLNELSLANLPKGIYIVKASIGNKTITGKVIK